jgi:hypothetical protein
MNLPSFLQDVDGWPVKLPLAWNMMEQPKEKRNSSKLFFFSDFILYQLRASRPKS